MSWQAEVARLDPARDALIVKVQQRITREQAEEIKAEIRATLPELRVLILSQGNEVIVVRRTRRRTLVKAGRRCARAFVGIELKFVPDVVPYIVGTEDDDPERIDP